MTDSDKGWIAELDGFALFSPKSYAGPLFKLGLFHRRLSAATKAKGLARWWYDSSVHNNAYSFLFVGSGLELHAILWVNYDVSFKLQVFGFEKYGATEAEVVAMARLLAWEQFKGEIKAEDMEAFYRRKREEAEKTA